MYVLYVIWLINKINVASTQVRICILNRYADIINNLLNLLIGSNNLYTYLTTYQDILSTYFSNTLYNWLH